MSDTTVSIPTGDIDLAGTYARPDGTEPRPAALIIAGSGPLARDGNHRRLRLDVSQLLAATLAEAGWSTLRYDNRGVGDSAGDFLSTGFFDELDDAAAAFRWLAERDDVTHVVPIGHSAGALCAAELASRGIADHGAILLAPTASTGEETLVWQASQLTPTLPRWLQAAFRVFRTSLAKQQRKTLAKLRSSTDDVIRLQGQKVNAKWMREFIAYDPTPTLAAIDVPILALTGSKDVQVNPADLDTIADIAPIVATTVDAPDVDHLLRHEPAERSNPKQY